MVPEARGSSKKCETVCEQAGKVKLSHGGRWGEFDRRGLVFQKPGYSAVDHSDHGPRGGLED